MKVFEDFSKINNSSETAVAIGKFDGVHLGHQRLLRALRKAKKALGKGAKACVLMVIDPEKDGELMTPEERIAVFEKSGVDVTVIVKLTPEVYNIKAEQFLHDVILERLKAKIIVAGPDVSFGKNGEGNREFLEEYSAKYGFELCIIEKEIYKGQPISSSRIREALNSGNLYDADMMLGKSVVPDGDGAVLVIDKPQGYTSNDVVAKLRGILRTGKVGHTGTLDPMATGVLPVLIGKATKLSDQLTAEKKAYETVMQLGLTTDTQDITGKILCESPVECSKERVISTVRSFEGDIMQIPPMYSAIKIDGKKLYELAREGKEIERKPRPVTIHKIEILNVDLPFVSMRVYCSKGTYIRTLCHDIGMKLGCGGVMSSLRRTASGAFTLDMAITPDEAQSLTSDGLIGSHLISLEEVRRL